MNQQGKRFLRSAKCPQHNKPGVYRAPQQDFDGQTYWAFACSFLGSKKVHIFLARPDPHAPTKPEELEDWIKQQEAGRIAKQMSKRQ